MAKVIDGIYQKGVIKLLDKVDLEENEQIRITIVKRQAKRTGESRSLFGAFPDLRGITMEFLTHIEQKPGVLSGKPVIKGTRISVELILERLANGASFEQLMGDYDIEEEDIKAALLYARNVLSEEQILETV